MTEQERISHLEKENQQLRDQLDRIEKKKAKRKSLGFWFLKKSSTPLLGVKLKKSISNAINEFKERRTVSVDTVSDVSSNIIWRVTRIGIFAFVLSVIPSLILGVQLWLVINQNKLVGNQNTLIEAERRSSLVFVMDNVLSELSKELKSNGGGNISPVLESRIASLSRAMKPYQYEENGELIDKEISPERGQLLYSLVNSNMGIGSFTDIMIASDFSHTYFENVFLGRGSNLKNAKLSYSNLSGAQLAAVNLERSELREANMRDVNLSDAVLNRANLANADLRKSELLSADLTYTNLYGADLSEADLSEATLWGTKLDEANLSDVVLDNAIVHRQDWLSFISDSLDLKGSERIRDAYKIKKQGEKQFILIPR